MSQRYLFLFIGIIILSLVVNAFLVVQMSSLSNNSKEAEQYPLLARRIFLENANDIIINFLPLRSAIYEYIAKQNNIIDIYFEYLPSALSISANNNQLSYAASLMKIPVVTTVYHQIETGGLHKDDILTLKKEHIDSRYGSLWQRGEGATVTVKEAIRFALVESDNTAARVLSSVISDEAFFDVLSRLDLDYRLDENAHTILISPKGYSNILRSLYLSSYLTPESSNEILKMLTETKFSNKIVAGIPKDIPVAHKIGTFTEVEETKQVHSDCGIVYVPKRPYLLCIMSHSTEQQAIKHMQYLSQMIYKYIVTINNGSVSPMSAL